MVFTQAHSRRTLNMQEVRQIYGTHTLAFQTIFVCKKIISLIFTRFSYVSLIRKLAFSQGIKSYWHEQNICKATTRVPGLNSALILTKTNVCNA
jgi:hypothetical protein